LIRVWHIGKKEYAHVFWSGNGAFYWGGRWTPKGYPVVYTSESKALALLEILIRFKRQTAGKLEWVIGHADVPEYTIYTPPDKDLPTDWRTYPYPLTTVTLGRLWLKTAKHAVLSVPSALEPTSRNYLINVQHPDTSKIHFSSIQDYLLDHRA
jgi:RES domain-containing protein